MEVIGETVVKHRGSERQPRGKEWAELLEQLARQLDNGRLYDRDLTAVRTALRLAVESSARRPGPRPPRPLRTRAYAPWQLYK